MFEAERRNPEEENSGVLEGSAMRHWNIGQQSERL